MYGKYIIAFLIGLISSVSFAQSTDCTIYKNGKFRLTDPHSKKVSIITRDGDKQTEKMEDAAEVYEFNVKWLDDCTYTITPTAATSARSKEITDIGTMTVRIVKVKDSSYTQTIKITNYPNYKRTDEMVVIKED